jgi:hypothetical protein
MLMASSSFSGMHHRVQDVEMQTAALGPIDGWQNVKLTTFKEAVRSMTYRPDIDDIFDIRCFQQAFNSRGLTCMLRQH